MTTDERARIVSALIRKVFESLESHLDWTFTDHADGRVFHKRTIRDYADQIKKLSDLL